MIKITPNYPHHNEFLKIAETAENAIYAITPINIRGKIEISGFKNIGFAMQIAKKNEQQPKIVPPSHIPSSLLNKDKATAKGKVKIAGVKLPKNAVKR